MSAFMAELKWGAVGYDVYRGTAFSRLLFADEIMERTNNISTASLD